MTESTSPLLVLFKRNKVFVLLNSSVGFLSFPLLSLIQSHVILDDNVFVAFAITAIPLIMSILLAVYYYFKHGVQYSLSSILLFYLFMTLFLLLSSAVSHVSDMLA